VIESTCNIEQLFSWQERTYSNIKRKEEKKSIPLLTGHGGRCQSRAWGLQSRRSLRFKTSTPQKDPFVPFLLFFIFLFRLRDSRHTCLKASLHSNSLVIYCAWMASTPSHLYLIIRVLLSFLPFSVGQLPPS
jgi:hypothetical protein